MYPVVKKSLATKDGSRAVFLALRQQLGYFQYKNNHIFLLDSQADKRFPDSMTKALKGKETTYDGKDILV